MEDRGQPNSVSRRDAARVFHPYAAAGRLDIDGPMVIARGEGIYIYDEDGKDYIESLAVLGAVSLGFGNRRLAAAAARQIETLSFYHTFQSKTNPPVVELAERLLAIAPPAMAKVFFTSSGSEANDTAIKLIWFYNNALGRPARKKILSRHGAYHGVTVATASLTGLAANHRDFDLPLPGFLHADSPHHYRKGRDGETEGAFAARMADDLERLILREGPETIAAMFLEPVMGAGGMIFPPADYCARVAAVLRKHDILLVADEVICGFGRTGRMWGAETYGIAPDMVAVGKALSSGYMPIAGLMMSDAVFDVVRRHVEATGVWGHGFTYSGHPVAAAVANETLKIYAETDIVAHVAAVAPALRRGIARFADHPNVADVGGVGLMASFELVADKATKRPFDPALAVGPQLRANALRHGLVVRAIGDRIGFTPPLVIDDAGIAEMFRRFERALADTTDAIGRAPD
ncbi:MAG: aminotransferase [Rhodospirillales bacterium]